MRVAGIDCGTNSIRLLIAEAGRDGGLRDIVRRMEVVRLGQGVDATGEFAREALERTFARTQEYADLCREHGVQSIRFAATSAARDARNREAFIEGIRSRIGVEPQILTGQEEARASFEGAASAIPAGVDGPVLTVDLGGGSTELALGLPGGQILGSFSMDVGCVRLHERHLVSDPPSPGQIAGARADVRAMLDRAEEHIDLGATTAVIGLAGTVTTLTATALGLERYDPWRIHGAVLTVRQTLEVCEWYLRSTREERAGLGFMHPGRVDVISSGALVWGEIVRRVERRMAESGRELSGITTSEHDILDGLAIWAARQPQAPDARVLGV
ncbi:MAG: exopolyphosphatase [Actinomycetaceae bacterium]|nr:exopolyphosphatase [Actinomycetaceae bacterium]